MAAQRKNLMQTLAVVVAGIDRLETLVPAVEALGRRHAGYGVKASHYATVGRALLDTLAHRARRRVHARDVAAAWGEAYELLAERDAGGGGRRGGGRPPDGSGLLALHPEQRRDLARGRRRARRGRPRRCRGRAGEARAVAATPSRSWSGSRSGGRRAPRRPGGPAVPPCRAGARLDGELTIARRSGGGPKISPRDFAGAQPFA